MKQKGIGSKNITVSDMIYAICKNLFVTVFTILCIYPFYYIVIYSISDPVKVQAGGFMLLPRGINFQLYIEVLRKSEIVPAFLISAARTVLGTVITVFCTSTLAFLVTRKDFSHRKALYRYCIITMYVGGGLIPWYIFMKAYHLQNSFLLYIIPGAINAYHMILVKTFIEQLPEALEESAMIEGAGFFDILLKIVLPLSKPILATIAVYNAVGQWNSWQDNYFLVQDNRLKTLQLLLQEYLRNSKALEEMVKNGIAVDQEMVANVISSKNVQMVTMVVVVTPILLVYPFAQKYFTKGLMMGAVKG